MRRMHPFKIGWRPFILQRSFDATAASRHCLPEDYEVRNARRMSSQGKTVCLPICRCAYVSLMTQEKEI